MNNNSNDVKEIKDYTEFLKLVYIKDSNTPIGRFYYYNGESYDTVDNRNEYIETSLIISKNELLKWINEK